MDIGENVVYWPPAKGSKTVGYYVALWTSPGMNWFEYEILDVLLESGTKEECDEMLRFNTTDECDTDVDETVDATPVNRRIESPEINQTKALIKKMRNSTLPGCSPLTDEGFVPLRSNEAVTVQENNHVTTNNIVIPRRSPRKKNQENSPSNISFTSSSVQSRQPNCKRIVSDNQQPGPSAKRSLNQVVANAGVQINNKYGDGGVMFTEMPNKQFQYVVLMELQKLGRKQRDLHEQLRTMNNLDNLDENQLGDEKKILEPFDNLEEFDAEERKLKKEKEERDKKRSQIKQIGGKDARACVRHSLDAILTRKLQRKFSKDGQKGKIAFTKTEHYKCLLVALVDEVNTKEVIDFFIGDLLKRANRKPEKKTEEELPLAPLNLSLDDDV